MVEMETNRAGKRERKSTGKVSNRFRSQTGEEKETGKTLKKIRSHYGSILTATSVSDKQTGTCSVTGTDRSPRGRPLLPRGRPPLPRG